tara:strand:+ start:180 stop:740 length:561 start_codon:yes stop_codon:yes gene_type:complete
MSKVELFIVALTQSESVPGKASLILEDVKHSRRLPVIIGNTEAQSIALVLERMKPKRPQTHDLLVNALKGLKGVLKEVIIDRYEAGVFYSKLIIKSGDEFIELDSRVSDAIAISCRMDTPIFINEEVFVAISLDNDLESIPKSTRGGLTNYSLEELEDMLQKVLLKEDYISATRIRDAIEKKMLGN